MDRSFRFVDAAIQRELLGRFRKTETRHTIDSTGAICFSPENEEFVESELIGPVRSEIFPTWQLVTCPVDWTIDYKTYMDRHEIPYREELSDGELWFLIPRKHRPGSWKIEKTLAESALAASH